MCLTLTEVLPASKTSARAMRWTPSAAGRGELVVEDKRSSTAYSVVKLATGPDFPGTAVAMGKRDGEVYHCRVGTSARDVDCTCAGFTYGGGRRLCKHLAALEAMIENRWLDAEFDAGDEPEANEDRGEVCEELAAVMMPF